MTNLDRDNSFTAISELTVSTVWNQRSWRQSPGGQVIGKIVSFKLHLKLSSEGDCLTESGMSFQIPIYNATGVTTKHLLCPIDVVQLSYFWS